MKDTHEFPDNNLAQDPGEDCELPEPVRTSYFQTADCVHGTKFLLVTGYDGDCSWKDAEKYWAGSRENTRYYYMKEPQITDNYFSPGPDRDTISEHKNVKIEKNYFIDTDWEDES